MDLSELAAELPGAINKNSIGTNTNSKYNGCIYTKKELDAFLLSSWYKRFKGLTIPTRCVIMPKGYALLIGTGGIQEYPDLDFAPGPGPKEDTQDKIVGPSWKEVIRAGTEKLEKYDECDDEKNSWETFGDFHDKVTEAIKQLGGTVVPKVLWKVPTDMKGWFHFGLKGSTSEDIDSLIKFSQRAYEAIYNPYQAINISWEEVPPAYLYLRKWMNFQDADVFRCFVFGGKLKAICQKDLSVGYESIVSERNAIIQDVYNFYKDYIFENFDRSMECYAIDVIRFGLGEIRILDFNPCDDRTVHPYFYWRDLIDLSEETVKDEEVGTTSNKVQISDGEKTGTKSLGTEGDSAIYYKYRQPTRFLTECEKYGNPYFLYSTINVFKV